MGLYNMIFGTQSVAPLVLALLGKEPGYFGRFRDAWVEKDGKGGIRLAVYTRNGGGNREHWDDTKEAGPECGCTGCTIEFVLPQHPLYLSDADDDFDCTYATVYFKLPDDIDAKLKELGAPDGFDLAALAADEPVDMSDVWQKAITSIGNTGT